MDFLTASRGFDKVTDLMQHGQSLDAIAQMDGMSTALSGYQAWIHSPTIGGLHVVANLPALAITFVITALVYMAFAIKRASNAMVYLKLGVIILVIIVGSRYVKASTGAPFAPNGV